MKFRPVFHWIICSMGRYRLIEPLFWMDLRDEMIQEG